MKSTHAADAALDATIDAISNRFDAARNAAVRRLEGAVLTTDEALLVVFQTLTEAAERCAPEVRGKRTTRPTLTGNAVPFGRAAC